MRWKPNTNRFRRSVVAGAADVQWAATFGRPTTTCHQGTPAEAAWRWLGPQSSSAQPSEGPSSAPANLASPRNLPPYNGHDEDGQAYEHRRHDDPGPAHRSQLWAVAWTIVRVVGTVPLKLLIEVVPKPCWDHNLRNALTKDRWLTLSRGVRGAAGQCEICGSTDRLQCDEQWTYDELNHVQHLIGLRCVCQACHSVIHFGRTSKLARQQADRYPTLVEDTIAHFMRVNGVDRNVFKQHWIAASEAHSRRSAISTWTSDNGAYGESVKVVEADRAARANRRNSAPS